MERVELGGSTASLEHMRLAQQMAVKEGVDLQVAGGALQWNQSVEHFSRFLSINEAGEIKARLGRGVAYRMVCDYTSAEADFKAAAELSRDQNDADGELTATAGLIDLARTGDRDQEYYRGKNLDLAQVAKLNAEAIISKMPEDPTLGKVEAYINFGLLEDGLSQKEKAVESYNLAEQNIDALLAKEPENSYYQNRFSRIMTVKGVTLMALERFDEAAALQEKAYDKYTELNDLRGRGNAAISRAQVAEKMNESEVARTWFNLALELSPNDPEINNIAKEGLARLSS